MKELKAREGYYLTQNSDNVENRIFVTAIKGMNIHELDWREAALEEKEEYEKNIEYVNEEN